MGVNVRCEVCNKFIRHVEFKDLSSIQTDEICDDCSKKINKLYADFDSSIAKFKTEMEKLFLECRAELSDRIKKGVKCA